MITGDILRLVNQKLISVRNYLILIGVLFFILAAAILFFPEVLQIVFVIAFFAVSFAALLIAVKINNIKDSFERITSIIPNKKRGRSNK